MYKRQAPVGDKFHLRNDATVMIKAALTRDVPTKRFRWGPSALARVALRIVSSGLPLRDGHVDHKRDPLGAFAAPPTATKSYAVS